MSSKEKPIMANHDYPFFDSEVATTSGTQQVYNVGKNQRDSPGGMKKLFVSKETLIKCDQDVYIRFNKATSYQHTFYANVYYTVRSNIWAVFYEQVSVAGTLELKFDGVLSMEARASGE